MAQSLTPSQREALLIVARRGTKRTTTSSRNQPNCIAAGSAERLEALGLIEWKGAGRRKFYLLTEAGREVVETMEPARG